MFQDLRKLSWQRFSGMSGVLIRSHIFQFHPERNYSKSISSYRVSIRTWHFYFMYFRLKKYTDWHICTSNLNHQMVWTRSLMLVAFNTFVSINFFLVEQVKTGCIMDMSRLDIILNDHNLFLIYAVMRYNSVLVLTMNTNGKVGARNCCLSYQLVNLSGPRGYLDIWNTEMLRYSNHRSDLITLTDCLTHSPVSSLLLSSVLSK